MGPLLGNDVIGMHFEVDYVNHSMSPLTIASSAYQTTMITCDASGGAVDLRPNFASQDGKLLIVKKIDATTNTCTVDLAATAYTMKAKALTF